MSDVPPNPPSTPIVVHLGDPNAHAHAWKTKGNDAGGVHDLICGICGEIAIGYGDYELHEPKAP
jgi:hypothetical protein